jgi:ABC-type uncharacterized transport system substrate-binding protein
MRLTPIPPEGFDLVPNATTFAILANPRNSNSEPDVREVEAAVRSRGLQPILIEASDAVQFEAGFLSITEQHVDALVGRDDASMSGAGNRWLASALTLPSAAITGDYA